MTDHTQPGDRPASDGDTGSGAPDTMFDSIKGAAGDIAERAAPTVREISARAAELTATAAVKAAPFVRRAGEAAADASLKLAKSASGWAADLRSDNGSGAHDADAAGPASASVADAADTMGADTMGADTMGAGHMSGTADEESTTDDMVGPPVDDDAGMTDEAAGMADDAAGMADDAADRTQAWGSSGNSTPWQPGG